MWLAIYIAIFTIIDITAADLTLYCENYGDRNSITYGGLKEYRTCLLNC